MSIIDILIKLSPEFISKRIKNSIGLRKILRNINWLTGERVLRMILGVFISVVVVRYLGPKKLGMMKYAISFVAIFSAFNKLGLKSIVVRNIVENPEKKEKILGSTLFLKFTGTVIMFAVCMAGIMLIRPAETKIQLFVLIILIGYIFKSFETFDLWFESQVQSKYSVYARSISFLIISVLKVLLVIYKQPLVAFVLIVALDSVIAALAWFFLYEKKAPFSFFKWEININTMKDLLKDSWPLILGSIAVIIYMKIDQVMIGKMINDTALGKYSVAVGLSEKWYFIPTVITGSVFPSIVKTRSKNIELYKHRLQNLYDFFTWFTVITSLIIAFLSPYIISILYGNEFIEAADVLSIHIWSGIFVFLGVASSKYLIAENYTKISFYRTALGAISNIILNIILIPIFGIIGAAWATLISYMISVLSTLIFPSSRPAGIQIIKSFNLLRCLK